MIVIILIQRNVQFIFNLLTQILSLVLGNPVCDARVSANIWVWPGGRQWLLQIVDYIEHAKHVIFESFESGDLKDNSI